MVEVQEVHISSIPDEKESETVMVKTSAPPREIVAVRSGKPLGQGKYTTFRQFANDTFCR
jgi:CO/xanthine dehydrogenase Mo-binding subunit